MAILPPAINKCWSERIDSWGVGVRGKGGGGWGRGRKEEGKKEERLLPNDQADDSPRGLVTDLVEAAFCLVVVLDPAAEVATLQEEIGGVLQLVVQHQFGVVRHQLTVLRCRVVPGCVVLGLLGLLHPDDARGFGPVDEFLAEQDRFHVLLGLQRKKNSQTRML